MTAAWMVRQGEGGSYAQQMIDEGYMGVDFIGDHDLTPHWAVGREVFGHAVTELFYETNPEKGKIAAGLAVKSLRLAAEGITEGDMILAPIPNQAYEYGVAVGPYEYHPGTGVPHRRRVE